jgi:hypothetical protein
MAQFTFQATGYAGGLLHTSLDTEQELQQQLQPALEARGLRVIGLSVEADEWDVFSRLFSNQFHYRVTTTVDTTHAAAVTFAEFVQALQSLTGQPVTASNVTGGDPNQQLPNSNPFPGLSAGVNSTLVLVAIVVVAVAVVLWEAK